MDQSTFVTRLSKRLNITSSDPLYAQLDEYVNEALHFLETSSAEGYPWYRNRFALTTTAGDNDYPFTTISTTYTITKILDCDVLVQDSVYEPMDLVNAETSTQWYGSVVNRSKPEAWFAEGQTLYIYPIPDAAYTVRVRATVMEPDLGGSSSTPILPVVFHQAVIDAALLVAYQELQDVNRMDVQNRKVEQWVTRMKQYGAEYASAPRILVRDPLWV